MCFCVCVLEGALVSWNGEACSYGRVLCHDSGKRRAGSGCSCLSSNSCRFVDGGNKSSGWTRCPRVGVSGVGVWRGGVVELGTRAALKLGDPSDAFLPMLAESVLFVLCCAVLCVAAAQTGVIGLHIAAEVVIMVGIVGLVVAAIVFACYTTKSCCFKRNAIPRELVREQCARAPGSIAHTHSHTLTLPLCFCCFFLSQCVCRVCRLLETRRARE